MAQGGPLFFDSLCLLMCKGYYSALKAVLLGRNLAPTLRHCVIDILYSLHELNCVEWLIWSSLVAQTVKRLPAMQETWVQFLVGKIHWRRGRLPTPVFLGFPGGSAGKKSICSAGDLGLVPGLGKSPGEGKGYPLRNCSLENSMD